MEEELKLNTNLRNLRSMRSAVDEVIQTVTSSTFSRLVLAANGPVVVEFMSYSCSHCGALEPALRQVVTMVEEKGKIFRVNTASEQELSASYNVSATPTLVMFFNGKEVGRVEGPQPTVAGLLTAIAQPFRKFK